MIVMGRSFQVLTETTTMEIPNSGMQMVKKTKVGCREAITTFMKAREKVNGLQNNFNPEYLFIVLSREANVLMRCAALKYSYKKLHAFVFLMLNHIGHHIKLKFALNRFTLP